MSLVTDLQAAAGQCYDRMHIQFLIGNNLKTRLGTFTTQSLLSFPDSDPNARPIANWLTVQDAQRQNIASPPTLVNLSVAAQYMYKCLWLTSKLVEQGLVTTVQGNVILGNFDGLFPP